VEFFPAAGSGWRYRLPGWAWSWCWRLLYPAMVVHRAWLGARDVLQCDAPLFGWDAIFNGNPLMRYDGYYVLTELLETPNLAEQASALMRQSAVAVVSENGNGH